MDLKELKQRYAEVQAKYSLPEFTELNRVFEIDRIEHEPEFMVHAVKDIVVGKIQNSLQFLEGLMNPHAGSLIYMTYSKNLSSEDMKIVKKLFEEFSDLVIASLELETEHVESKEAEFVNLMFRKWKELSPDFSVVLSHFRKSDKQSSKAEKNYFG